MRGSPFTYEESDAALREHDGSTRFYSIRDSSFFLTSSAVPPFKTARRHVLRTAAAPAERFAERTGRRADILRRRRKRKAPSSLARQKHKCRPCAVGKHAGSFARLGSGENIAGSDTHSLVHFPLSHQRENAHAQRVVLRTQAVALAEHALNRARKL